ncbi:MAG: alginate export family protein [Bacteroidales bacterium]
MKKVFILLLLVVFGFQSFAQFKLDAEIRSRAEFRRGYRQLPAPDQKAAGLLSQRTRLNVHHEFDRVTSYISFQDVRIFGEERQKVDVPSTTLHEGWVELQANENFFIKVGRQEINYDNGRFIARNNWNDNAQKHDLVLFKWQNDKNQHIHFATAFNQDNSQLFGTEYNVDNYKYMNILHAHSPINDKGSISLLGIADAYENDINSELLYMRGTYSAHFKYDFTAVDLMFNPAFQNGKTSDGQDIAAYYFSLEMGSSMVENYRYLLGFELFSGNDGEDTDDDKFRAFDPTHGYGHAPNGYMDYFLNFPVHTSGAGLFNLYFKNTVNITPKVLVNLDIHAFFLANNLVQYNFDSMQLETIDKYLGLEPDLSVFYKFNDFTRLDFGYSFMLGTESMEIIKGGANGDKDEWAHWAYVMLTVKPKLFGF